MAVLAGVSAANLMLARLGRVKQLEAHDVVCPGIIAKHHAPSKWNSCTRTCNTDAEGQPIIGLPLSLRAESSSR